MRAAGMSGLVIVMAALKIFIDLQFVRQKRFDDFIHIAGRPANQLHSRLSKRNLRASADPAANQQIDSALPEEACQRAMPRVSAGQDLLGDHVFVFHGKDSKLRRVAEMLKHLIIFARNCNFHFILLILFDYFMKRQNV